MKRQDFFISLGITMVVHLLLLGIWVYQAGDFPKSDKSAIVSAMTAYVADVPTFVDGGEKGTMRSDRAELTENKGRPTSTATVVKTGTMVTEKKLGKTMAEESVVSSFGQGGVTATGNEMKKNGIEGAVIAPQLVYAPAARYPEKSKQKGITGVVRVHFIVTDRGHVVGDSIRLLSSSGSHELDESAIDAVRKYQFIAAKNEAGNAMSCGVTLSVGFRKK